MAVEQLIALVEIFFACFLFGSLFVPVKRYNPGDGLFFWSFCNDTFFVELGISIKNIFSGLFAQFLMCLAIFFVGFGCFVYNEFEGFYPLAMLGGASWCLGRNF